MKEFTIARNYDKKVLLTIDHKVLETDFDKEKLIKIIKDRTYGQVYHKEIEDSAKEFITYLESNCSIKFLNVLINYFSNRREYSIAKIVHSVLKDEQEWEKIEEETGYINDFRK